MLNNLSSKIEEGLSFDPLKDLKRDLFVHFEIEQGVIDKMTEQEVYDFFDDLEDDCEPKETFDFLCNVCKKETKFQSIEFNDNTDCVECKCCECGNFESISEFFFDEPE